MRRVSFVVSALYPRPYFETYLHVSAHHSFCHHLPPPLLFFSHSLQTFFATLSYFLYPSLHPRLNPIPSHSHLSNSYPPLSISSPAPYPSYSTSVGMTDCWNWADSPPRRLQTIPYNRNYVTPPPIPSPSARIDYPTLQGDNQWAWPDFETWWVRACV